MQTGNRNWSWRSNTLSHCIRCPLFSIFMLHHLKKCWLCLYKSSSRTWVCRLHICAFSQFNHSVVSNSLQPHELQHTRPPCPSPTPGVHPNPCPSSQRCPPTISSFVVPFSSCPQSFPGSGSFPVPAFHIRWPKYRSFSISPSNEYSGLISLRMDWLDLLAVQGTQESSPIPQFKSINSSALSFLTPVKIQGPLHF